MSFDADDVSNVALTSLPLIIVVGGILAVKYLLEELKKLTKPVAKSNWGAMSGALFGVGAGAASPAAAPLAKFAAKKLSRYSATLANLLTNAGLNDGASSDPAPMSLDGDVASLSLRDLLQQIHNLATSTGQNTTELDKKITKITTGLDQMWINTQELSKQAGETLNQSHQKLSDQVTSHHSEFENHTSTITTQLGMFAQELRNLRGNLESEVTRIISNAVKEAPLQAVQEFATQAVTSNNNLRDSVVALINQQTPSVFAHKIDNIGQILEAMNKKLLREVSTQGPEVKKIRSRILNRRTDVSRERKHPSTNFTKKSKLNHRT